MRVEAWAGVIFVDLCIPTANYFLLPEEKYLSGVSRAGLLPEEGKDGNYHKTVCKTGGGITREEMRRDQ